MFGTTLVAGVSHYWQLSLGPHPVNLSSSTFNTKVVSILWTILQPFNTRVVSILWTILQPSYVGWRQHGRHLLYH